MADLLLELFGEEIPARMQVAAAEALRDQVLSRLTAAGIEPSSATVHSTPRRLALHLTGLPTATPDVREERKGPKVGAPQGAIDGFLKSAGLSSLDSCEQRDTPKGAIWVAVVEKRGQGTAELLARAIPAAIRALPWPKSMRWAGNAFSYVRPLSRILALFDGAVLPLALDLSAAQADTVGTAGALQSGNETEGHRFTGRGPFAVTGFEDYAQKLAAHDVVLDRAERQRRIEAQLAALAGANGIAVKPDAGLLQEVVGLVENPHVLLGRIDDAFMEVPPEVLSTSMRTHQKYFSLLKADGSLAPHFAVVANILPADGGAAIVAGNERVLRARLSDARFFWSQDKAVPLADRVPALDRVTFHAKLGTVGQKVARISALAGRIAPLVPGAEVGAAHRAALLAKADLTSGMVGEFPELQGLMGRYYALAQGESEAVASAIADHYSPQGPGDRCPSAPVSIAVALADRIDTLTGFFAIDEKPTGSRDPYALRRAALGIIRLVVENGLRLPLDELFAEAHALYGIEGFAPAERTVAELLDFLADRLKVALKDRGVRHDLIAAVFALGRDGDLARVLARVDALQALLGTGDGANLLTAHRRAMNIVRIESAKDKAEVGQVDTALLEAAEERELASRLSQAASAAEPLLAAEDYSGVMRILAELRAPIDRFFETVMVNAENPALRRNRLALLAELGRVLGRVAAFDVIEASGTDSPALGAAA